MTKERIAFGLAVLELLSALPLYGIYTSPFRLYGADGFWSVISIVGSGLSILFPLLPFLAVIAFMRWRTRFLWLGLYPVVAFLFGVVPIPFATHLYTADKMINTYFIAAIDVLWIGIVAWLYWSIKRSNNTLQPTGYAGG